MEPSSRSMRARRGRPCITAVRTLERRVPIFSYGHEDEEAFDTGVVLRARPSKYGATPCTQPQVSIPLGRLGSVGKERDGYNEVGGRTSAS